LLHQTTAAAWGSVAARGHLAHHAAWRRCHGEGGRSV